MPARDNTPQPRHFPGKGPAEEAGEERCHVGSILLDQESCNFYCNSVEVMKQAGIPFLVGGAYALERYAGISRHTKDFDLFVYERDIERALKAFSDAGYKTELSFPHWLGKAYQGDLFIDLIFSSGNGLARVDDEWFSNAVEGRVLGAEVMLCPAEEIIWSKCFVCERERYDGADVAHLLQACAGDLDWDRLLRRFGTYWRVLLAHLVLFGFIFPAERDKIPEAVMRTLTARLEEETTSRPPNTRVVQGTLISRQQYLVDVEQRGYEDARAEPVGNMSERELQIWTDAIETGK